VDQGQQYQLLRQRFSDPRERLKHLQRRQGHIKRMRVVTQVPEWQEIVTTIEVSAKQHMRATVGVDPTNAESLASFGDRALFNAGFVQGLEYLKNDALACAAEEKSIDDMIKQTEAELKAPTDAR
jgi:hypothetical protein